MGTLIPLEASKDFKSRGASRITFRTNTTVTGIGTDMVNGCRRFCSIKTGNDSIAAGNAMLATGVQTNLLLADLGVYIPMTTPIVSAFQTIPVTTSLGPVIGVANGDLAVRQQIDGRLRFTGGAEQLNASLDLSGEYPAVYPPAASIARAISSVCSVLPFVSQTPICRIWEAFRFNSRCTSGTGQCSKHRWSIYCRGIFWTRLWYCSSCRGGYGKQNTWQRDHYFSGCFFFRAF